MIYHYYITSILLLKSVPKQGSIGIYLFVERKNLVIILRTNYRMVVVELHIDLDNLDVREKIFIKRVLDNYKRLNDIENYEI